MYLDPSVRHRWNGGPEGRDFEIRKLSDYLDLLDDFEYDELEREYSAISPQRHSSSFSEMIYEIDPLFEDFFLEHRRIRGCGEWIRLYLESRLLTVAVPDVYDAHEFICFLLFKGPGDSRRRAPYYGNSRGPLRFRHRPSHPSMALTEQNLAYVETRNDRLPRETHHRHRRHDHASHHPHGRHRHYYDEY